MTSRDALDALLPCPFCGKDNALDQYPSEFLDGTGANVVRCAWCHGAAPMKTWNRRHLSTLATAAEAGDGRVPILWRVDTQYGRGYVPSDEFIEAFPRFPIPKATGHHWTDLAPCQTEGCVYVAGHLCACRTEPTEAIAQSAPLTAAQVSHDDVSTALNARVPGGAAVWHWLPNDGQAPSGTARTIMHTALAALRQQEEK